MQQEPRGRGGWLENKGRNTEFVHSSLHQGLTGAGRLAAPPSLKVLGYSLQDL